MEHLDPAYLNARATQIGSMSAFLGGFAATALTALLAAKRERERPAGWAMGLSAVAAVALILAVLAATFLVAVFHPQAPRSVARAVPDGARTVMALSFLVGMLTLMAAVGVSGWVHSRRLGAATTTSAALGLLLVISLTPASDRLRLARWERRNWREDRHAGRTRPFSASPSAPRPLEFCHASR